MRNHRHGRISLALSRDFHGAQGNARLRLRPPFWPAVLSPLTGRILAEFETSGNPRLAGEASVWYPLSTSAAKEIKAFNADARIIIMLRDPVEMLHSLYHTFRWDGNEQLPTFAEALAAESDRRAGHRLGRETYLAQGLLYSETVRYVRQVIRYFDVFGPDRVQVIIYDDLRRDTAGVYRRALDFLGVEAKSSPLDFKPVNGNKQVKSTAVRTLFSEPRLRSAILAIRPWLPRVAFKVMQTIDARIRKFNSHPAIRPLLEARLERQLRSEFAPEVEELSALLGRDLTHWSSEFPTRQPVESASRSAQKTSLDRAASGRRQTSGSVVS